MCVHNVKIGDYIRAFDFEPMQGRPDRFIEGFVTSIENEIAVVHVIKDTCFPLGTRLTVNVPLNLPFSDFKNRITVLYEFDS